jgi:hypothetical protein
VNKRLHQREGKLIQRNSERMDVNSPGAGIERDTTELEILSWEMHSLGSKVFASHELAANI